MSIDWHIPSLLPLIGSCLSLSAFEAKDADDAAGFTSIDGGESLWNKGEPLGVLQSHVENMGDVLIGMGNYEKCHVRPKWEVMNWMNLDNQPWNAGYSDTQDTWKKTW